MMNTLLWRIIASFTVNNMWGTTIVQCMSCKDKKYMHGWLPTADEIWLRNEGLLCCDQQTHIVRQIKDEI